MAKFDLLHHQAPGFHDRRTPDAADPPPSNEEIRRQLGLALINAERQTRAERDERN